MSQAERDAAARRRLRFGIAPPMSDAARATARNEVRLIQEARELEQEAAFLATPLGEFKLRRCAKCGKPMSGKRARFDSDATVCEECEG